MSSSFSNAKINFIAEMNNHLEAASSFDLLLLLDNQKRLKQHGARFLNTITNLSKDFEKNMTSLLNEVEASVLDEKQVDILCEKFAELSNTTEVFRKKISSVASVTNSADAAVLAQVESTLLGSITKKIEKVAQAVFQKINCRIPPARAKRWYLHVEMDPSKSNLVRITKINKRQEIVEKVYVLGERIGKGGEGEAFMITPLDGIGKQKALKIAYKDNIAEASYAMNKSKDLVDKQLVDPKTGAAVRKIPGILNLKYVESTEGIGVSSLCNGNMKSIMKSAQPFDFLQRYVAQTAFAVNHLHSDTQFKPGVIHHDLKPENILYKENNGSLDFFIIDFNGAQEMNAASNSLTYTEGYLSREDHNAWNRDPKNKRLNSAMDVRALGLCWAEVLTHRLFSQEKPSPILSLNLVKNSAKIDGQLSPLQSHQLTKICHLISCMTAVDWQKRPSMKECVEYLASLGIEMPNLA